MANTLNIRSGMQYRIIFTNLLKILLHLMTLIKLFIFLNKEVREIKFHLKKNEQ